MSDVFGPVAFRVPQKRVADQLCDRLRELAESAPARIEIRTLGILDLLRHIETEYRANRLDRALTLTQQAKQVWATFYRGELPEAFDLLASALACVPVVLSPKAAPTSSIDPVPSASQKSPPLCLVCGKWVIRAPGGRRQRLSCSKECQRQLIRRARNLPDDVFVTPPKRKVPPGGRSLSGKMVPKKAAENAIKPKFKVGQVIGALYLERFERAAHGGRWLCQCRCGESVWLEQSMIGRRVLSCGCKSTLPESLMKARSGRMRPLPPQMHWLSLLGEGHQRSEKGGFKRTATCKCVCGRVVSISAYEYAWGHVRSCGCKYYSHKLYKPLPPVRYRLVLLTKEPYNKDRHNWVDVRCMCGKEISMTVQKYRKSKSCGAKHCQYHYSFGSDGSVVERMNRIRKGQSPNGEVAA